MGATQVGSKAAIDLGAWKGRSMPAQRPGQSKQDYATPREFLTAVLVKWNLPRFSFDLAANRSNTVAESWFGTYSEGNSSDSLVEDWSLYQRGHALWLNPPFANIEPWVRKCRDWGRFRAAAETDGKLFLLTPASVGANWFQCHVHDIARVYFLSPRLSFDGKNPYPKDCILSVFGEVPGYECWRWKP